MHRCSCTGRQRPRSTDHMQNQMSVHAQQAVFAPVRARRHPRLCAVQVKAAGFGSRAKPVKGGKAPPPPTQPKQCPCGSGRRYEECCEVYHRAECPKLPSAEAVLRARYCAYSKGLAKFVADTYHPSATLLGERVALLRDIEATCRSLDLHRLALLDKCLQPPEGLPEGLQILEYRLDFKVINQRGQKQKGNSLESRRLVDLFGTHQGGWLFIRELSLEEDQGLVSPKRQQAPA